MSSNMRSTGPIRGMNIFVKVGTIITSVSYRKERAKFEQEYISNGEGVFIFDVQDPIDGSWKCLDATRAYGTLGRLINHSSRPNLRPKVARVYGELRLGFLALRPINAGEQLFYNYGSQPHPPPWLSRRL